MNARVVRKLTVVVVTWASPVAMEYVTSCARPSGDMTRNLRAPAVFSTDLNSPRHSRAKILASVMPGENFLLATVEYVGWGNHVRCAKTTELIA